MFPPASVFIDRDDAGRQLAKSLTRFAGKDPVVLALPRGGVPVAHVVAEALQAPLDLLFVRKIGAPGHEEFGIGAVVDGASPQIVLNEEMIEQVGIPPHYIQLETQRQLREIERRRMAYLHGRKPIPVNGRTVIVVDDGIATGGTVRAALKALRLAGAGHTVLAVPVAPPEAIADLRKDVDEIVCLQTPTPFFSVGLHYRNFNQVSDSEVVRLIGASRHPAHPATIAGR